MDIPEHLTSPDFTYCIAAQSWVPAFQVDDGRVVVTQSRINWSICYTLNVRDSSLLRTLRETEQLGPLKEVFLDRLREEIYQRIYTKIPELKNISEDELRNIWKQYFSQGYTRESLDSYISHLQEKYSEKIGTIRDEIRWARILLDDEYARLLWEYKDILEQTLWRQKDTLKRDLVVILAQRINEGKIRYQDNGTIKWIYAELMRFDSDPKYRRLAYQDAISAVFQALEKYTGISLGIVSIGGVNRADGAIVVKTPPWQKFLPPFILGSRWLSLWASSLEVGLDALAIANTRPVSTQYLISPYGNLQTELHTPLTEWTKSVLFPSSQELRDWIYNPTLIPHGGEISVSLNSHGKSIILTKKTPKWWFLKLWIKEEELMWIHASSRYFTLWYSNNEWALRGNFAFTGSEVDFQGQDRRKDTQNTGISLVGNWEWKRNRTEYLTIWSRGHFSLWLQIGERWDIDYTQTARMGIETTAFIQYAFSPKLTGEIGLWSDRLWAPNLSPNTFWKVSRNDRRVTHFERSPILSSAISYKIPGWEIGGRFALTTGKLTEYTRASIDYTLWRITLHYHGNHQKSKHPLIGEWSEKWLSIVQRGDTTRLYGTIWSRKFWGKGDTFYQVGGITSF